VPSHSRLYIIHHQITQEPSSVQESTSPVYNQHILLLWPPLPAWPVAIMIY